MLMPALGMVLSLVWRAPDPVQPAKPWFREPWFYYCLLFGSAFGYGTAVACYLIAPDWMWMYILDSRYASWPLLVYISVMYHALLFAGLLTAETLRADRRMVWRGVYLLLAGTMLICAAWFSRLWHVGTASDFYQGQAGPLIQMTPFRLHPVVIAMAVAVLVGAVVFICLCMCKANKKSSGK